MAWYDNILDTGANVFGAGEGGNANKLEELGLIAKGARDKAKRQSMFQGLLGLGTSLIAQPRDKNYGSALPYVGKALLTGMDFAQSPFDKMGKDAEMAQKLKAYEDAQKIKNAREDYKSRLYTTTPGKETLTNQYQPINRQGLDGQNIQAPNMGFAQQSKVSPSTSKMDMNVLNEILVNDTAFAGQILGNQKTMAEIQKLDAEANAESGIKLNKNYKPVLYTEDSYAAYSSKFLKDGRPNTDYGNDNVRRKSEAANAEFAVMKAKVQKNAYEIEKEQNVFAANEYRRDNKLFFPEMFKANQSNQTTNNTIPEQNIASRTKGIVQNKESGLYEMTPQFIKNNSVVLAVSGGSVVPEILNPGTETERRNELRANKGGAQTAIRDTVSEIKLERQLISKIINSGDLGKAFGKGTLNPFYLVPGSDAQNLKVDVDKLKNKEFMNNLIGSKTKGATFGALSDTEGRRLETILINLDSAQGPANVEKALVELDNFLADREKSIYESYQNSYGEYNYSNTTIKPYTTTYQTEVKEKPGAIKSITKVNP